MKKRIVIIIVLILMILITCLIINIKNKTNIEESDAIKFKNEYESLNNTSIKVNISEDNIIEYANYNETINLIKNETAIIYFGFSNCLWCRNAIPVLLDAAKELSIEKIYYFNALSIRDEKELDKNGNIVVKKEGTNEYKELVKLLYDYLPVYKGLNDDKIKRLYFPTVLFVKEGKIINLHTATVESQKDPNIKLSEEQYLELKNIYFDYINRTYDILCDETC